ncbi:hypothetical protein D7X33_15890 [Butyricicoccus sp. 1XD8-22]|nr:hypothetical protein D7X33_15890 [Butyricicoccus sp. 1XD8-22]
MRGADDGACRPQAPATAGAAHSRNRPGDSPGGFAFSQQIGGPSGGILHTREKISQKNKKCVEKRLTLQRFADRIRARRKRLRSRPKGGAGKGRRGAGCSVPA